MAEPNNSIFVIALVGFGLYELTKDSKPKSGGQTPPPPYAPPHNAPPLHELPPPPLKLQPARIPHHRGNIPYEGPGPQMPWGHPFTKLPPATIPYGGPNAPFKKLPPATIPYGGAQAPFHPLSAPKPGIILFFPVLAGLFVYY